VTSLSDSQEEDGEAPVEEAPIERKKGKKNNAETKKPKEKGVRIDLSIDLSAYANARDYFTIKKQSAVKQEKTLSIAEKAFKSAEKKIKQDMKQIAQNKRVMNIQKARKRYWFEKFLWFISSENYLVIAGRDMQQNELLVKRHLSKHDVYVHADLHGAATVIIKNTTAGGDIPPTTLYQAGVMSVCWSKAWDAKMSTSAYWVHAHQVSKTAPTGEYLTTGSFMIRGKKNFLPPVQLVYGFGIMFRLDASCVAKHIDDRRPNRDWMADAVEEEMEQLEEEEEPEQVQNGLFLDWDKYHLADHGDEAQPESSNVIGQLIASNTVTLVEPAKEPPKQPNKKKVYKQGKKSKRDDKEPKPVVDKKQGPARRQRGKTGKKKDRDHWSSGGEEVGEVQEVVEAGVQVEEVEVLVEEEKEVEQQEEVVEVEQQEEVEVVVEVEQQEEPTVEEEEESDSDTAAGDMDSLNLLDTLTGQPLADDILLFAVPLCAPYSALQKFKYRAKLIPGSLKKGKGTPSLTISWV
jgi:hypothetical protein